MFLCQGGAINQTKRKRSCGSDTSFGGSMLTLKMNSEDTRWDCVSSSLTSTVVLNVATATTCIQRAVHAGIMFWLVPVCRASARCLSLHRSARAEANKSNHTQMSSDGQRSSQAGEAGGGGLPSHRRDPDQMTRRFFDPGVDRPRISEPSRAQAEGAI